MADFQYIKLSKLNREYLHSNSTSHKWPFSAVAELIDNAYDPGACASRIDINYEELNGRQCLSFTDNGNGLDAEAMHEMLSFGFSNKRDTPTHLAVGQYGNGFEAGSMRLGRDAIIFSYRRGTKTIGFLSQTFLEAIDAESVLVPIVSWDRKKMIQSKEAKPSLQAILQYSIFQTQIELFGQFNKISNRKGTRIIIYNLQRDANGELEFDINRDKHDIIIAGEFASAGLAKKKQESDIPEYNYSLRAFCRILYMKPRLHIFLRGRRIETLFMAKTLSHTVKDKYRPKNIKLKTDEHVKITLGFNPRMDQYGIMMYHKNRLIKPYVKVGHQSKPDERGVGVLGLVECNFLDPTHNKQDFLDTNVYRCLIKAIGQKVNTYWDENKSIIDDKAANQPRDTWVQCSKSTCGKWRRLPPNANITAVKKNTWVCENNTDSKYSDCEVPEEPCDNEEVGATNTRTNKRKHSQGQHRRSVVPAKKACLQQSASPHQALSTAHIASEENDSQGQHRRSVVPAKKACLRQSASPHQALSTAPNTSEENDQQHHQQSEPSMTANNAPERQSLPVSQSLRDRSSSSGTPSKVKLKPNITIKVKPKRVNKRVQANEEQSEALESEDESDSEEKFKVMPSKMNMSQSGTQVNEVDLSGSCWVCRKMEINQKYEVELCEAREKAASAEVKANDLLKEKLALVTEMKSLTERNENLKEVQKEADKNLTEKDKAVKDLEMTKQKYAEQVKQAEEKNAKEEALRQQLNESIQEKNNEMQALRQQLNESLQEKNAEVQALKQQLKKSLQEKNAEVQALRQQLKKSLQEKNAEVQALTQQLNERSSDQVDCQALLSNLRTNIFDLLKMLISQDTDIESMVTDPQSSQVDDLVQQVLHDAGQ